MHGSKGGGGGGGDRGTPLKNHKNIGFLSNTGPDPLKNHIATKFGRHRQASETRFDDCPLIVVFGSFLPSSTQKKGGGSKLQSWTPSDKTFWIRVWPMQI